MTIRTGILWAVWLLAGIALTCGVPLVMCLGGCAVQNDMAAAATANLGGTSAEQSGAAGIDSGGGNVSAPTTNTSSTETTTDVDATAEAHVDAVADVDAAVGSTQTEQSQPNQTDTTTGNHSTVYNTYHQYNGSGWAVVVVCLAGCGTLTTIAGIVVVKLAGRAGRKEAQRTVERSMRSMELLTEPDP